MDTSFVRKYIACMVLYANDNQHQGFMISSNYNIHQYFINTMNYIIILYSTANAYMDFQFIRNRQCKCLIR